MVDKPELEELPSFSEESIDEYELKENFQGERADSIMKRLEVYLEALDL